MEKIKINLIKEKYRHVVFELLFKLRTHSKESYKHSLDVAEKALALGIALGIKEDDLSKLYTASLLHDIGKIHIDETLLHKPNVTDYERELIRVGHIEGTRSILKEYFDEDLVRLASHHHERLNSSGYPEHLNATKLDILDRILQVSDVTSALAMNRSYQGAYAPDQVIAILDNLVRRGELDKKCVKEIEKIFLEPLNNQAQLAQ
jgi:HD-GYP domain-containing protein (c-di-GMP phosphodiesterase class II)